MTETEREKYEMEKRENKNDATGKRRVQKRWKQKKEDDDVLIIVPQNDSTSNGAHLLSAQQI